MRFFGKSSSGGGSARIYAPMLLVILSGSAARGGSEPPLGSERVVVGSIEEDPTPGKASPLTHPAPPPGDGSDQVEEPPGERPPGERLPEEVSGDGESETCTYRSYAFDVNARKVTAHVLFEKSRARLTDEERDPADPRCTVCSEDQVTVAVADLPVVRICRHYADQVRRALETIVADGTFEIETLVGYRPGRTRGPVVDGKRTVFSNHSYGTAIDINAAHNGLYRDCRGTRTGEDDLRGCRRVMGGPWRPNADPRRSIAPGGVVYEAFTAFWKWGGDLPGQLKDFMHFSLTGE